MFSHSANSLSSEYHHEVKHCLYQGISKAFSPASEDLASVFYVPIDQPLGTRWYLNQTSFSFLKCYPLNQS